MFVHLPLTPTFALSQFLSIWFFLGMNALRCMKPPMFDKATSKGWHEMEPPLL